MTCIAGFTDGKTHAIAGDSGLFEDGDTNIWWPTRKPKVWRINGTLLGACGGNATKVAEESGLSDPRDLAAFLRERNISEDDPDWDVILVTRSGVTLVSDDYSVCPLKRKYHAIGGAAGPAWGALHTSKKLHLDPLTAVKFAVQAACDHHVYAIGPVVAKEIK